MRVWLPVKTPYPPQSYVVYVLRNPFDPSYLRTGLTLTPINNRASGSTYSVHWGPYSYSIHVHVDLHLLRTPRCKPYLQATGRTLPLFRSRTYASYLATHSDSPSILDHTHNKYALLAVQCTEYLKEAETEVSKEGSGDRRSDGLHS